MTITALAWDYERLFINFVFFWCVYICIQILKTGFRCYFAVKAWVAAMLISFYKTLVISTLFFVGAVFFYKCLLTICTYYP